MQNADGMISVHGWRILWRLRPPKPGNPGARGGNFSGSRNSRTLGDLTAYAPSGERIHSIVGIKRHLGVLEAWEDALPTKERRRSDVDAEQEAQDSMAPQVFVAERLVERRRRNGREQYRVRWQGYGPADDTDEPAANLAPELVAAYEASKE